LEAFVCSNVASVTRRSAAAEAMAVCS